jgi:hypothetical protein
MRNAIRRLALPLGSLLAAGGLVLATAATAGAAINTDYATGWQAGNNAWQFRFVEAKFTVPLHACGSDDFWGAGISLIGSSDRVTLGVSCQGSIPFAGYQFDYTGTTDPNSWSHVTAVASNHVILEQLYYDQTTDYVSLWAKDLTTGAVLVNDSHYASSARYMTVLAAAAVADPASYAPSAGKSFVLMPFTDVNVTSYNGVHGNGIEGRWGVKELDETNGAQVIAAAPDLYNGGTAFNVREYGNS